MSYPKKKFISIYMKKLSNWNIKKFFAEGTLTH